MLALYPYGHDIVVEHAHKSGKVLADPQMSVSEARQDDSNT